MRWIVLVLLAVSTPLVGSAPAAAQAGGTTVTPADPGVSNDIVIDHDCAADQVVGLLPPGGDLSDVSLLGGEGDSPVMTSQEGSGVISLGCASADDELEAGFDRAIGCFFVEHDGVAVTGIIPVPCLTEFGEIDGSRDFRLSVGEAPLSMRVEAVCSAGAVIVTDLLSGEANDFVEIDIAITPETDRLFAIQCDVDYDGPPRQCLRVVAGPVAIVEVVALDCTDYPFGDVSFRFVGDGQWEVAAGCEPGEAIGERTIDIDLVRAEPWGLSPVMRDFTPGHLIDVWCLEPLVGSGDYSTDSPHNLERRLGWFVVLGDPETGAVTDVIRYAASRSLSDTDRTDEATDVEFQGRVRVIPGVSAAPPLNVLDVVGSCWSDTVGTVSVVGSGDVFSGPVTLDLSERPVIPEELLLADGEQYIRTVARCKADGSTGLPDGRPTCRGITYVRGVPRATATLPCGELGVDDLASGRIALGMVSPGGGSLFVFHDCPEGEFARVVEVDASGRVLTELGSFDRSSGDEMSGVQELFDLPDGLALSEVAATCVAFGTELASTLETNAGANCFGEARVDFGHGGQVVTNRACAFVASTLPETGGSYGVLVMLASGLLAMGTALQFGARRSVKR